MFIDDIVKLLVDAAIGTYGTTIFSGALAVLPPTTSPTPFITLTETGGTDPWVIHNAASYRRPSVQVVARATTNSAARTLAESAYNVLKLKVNTSVNGVWYVSIRAAQEPTDLGLDAAGRARYSFNVQCTKR